MKKLLLFLILTSITFAQTGKQPLSPIQKDTVKAIISDSLDVIRTLIGTGGVPLPDSVLFSTDSTNQRTFSDLKYGKKMSVSLTEYLSLSDAVTSISTDEKILVIDENETLNADVTIPSNITLEFVNGAILTTNDSLVVNGMIRPTLNQIFAGSGSVVLGGSNNDAVYPEWWGIDGSADNIEIQKAIKSAMPTYSTLAIQGDNNWDYSSTGKKIILQDKSYDVDSTIEIYPHQSLIGQGIRSTVLVSSYDGQILRSNNDVTVYDYKGISLKDFAIRGDTTLTSQTGIDLLRVDYSSLYNITVTQIGGHGVILRQCVGDDIRLLETIDNKGIGLYIKEGIVGTGWTDYTSNGYPSNANYIYVHSGWNDSAGVVLDYVMGQTIEGISENNYQYAGDNVGYNVIIRGNGARMNTLQNLWVEGKAQAHIYINTGVAETNRIVNLNHFGADSTGNVDRAVIVNSGTVIITNAMNHGAAYKTINGSNAPFRAVDGAGIVSVLGGSQRYSTFQVEDENGNQAGNAYYSLQLFPYSTYWLSQGQIKNYTDNSLANSIELYRDNGSGDWTSYPFLAFHSSPTHGISFGSGAAAMDATLYRYGVDTLAFSGSVYIPSGQLILGQNLNITNGLSLTKTGIGNFSFINTADSTIGVIAVANQLVAGLDSVSFALYSYGKFYLFANGGTTPDFEISSDSTIIKTPILKYSDYNFPTSDGTSGYVIKTDGSGNLTFSPDISTSGTGTFNPDGVTIDTTALGLARVLPSKVTKWDSVTVKLNIADTTGIRTFSDLKYAATASFAIAPALLDDSLTAKMNRSEMTSYSTTAHTHIDFFDTLSISWGVLDTTYTGSLSGWKVPNDITITEISAYTDANTVTFNLEERAETTPNTAGTDVIGSDLVADTNQEETSTFTNANISKNTWLVPTISATGDVSIFTISVRYIKTD